ncbi:Amidase [Paracidovorax citrulli AAC00-1]|uniref:Amidase n=2 Tax=Paracidovorax citrulli TaxID=80869 RepID=A1TTS2_PARC0|nr:Amidase [Paracidovorax citrulli AAC00-1]
MMSGEIIELTAHGLTSAYRTLALSPVEAMRAVLDRVHEVDGDVNAFCALDEDGAMRSAAESEQRWLRGEPLGPLDGVPVSVKDMVATRGMATRFGSRTLPEDHLVEVDAPCIQELRRAGALIFGKTTTSEFGNKIVGDCPLTGITRNPWNLDRTAGGSSGGAGAALAARMGPLAVGSDGGGSIRVPSAWNGVCGLKPSFKRVPSMDTQNVGEVANIGPMARDVRDLATLLGAMARPWPRDWQASAPAEDFLAGLEAGVEGLRIAFSTDLGIVGVAPETARAAERAAGLLETLGARVTRLGRLAPLDDYMRSGMHTVLWTARLEHLVRGTPAHLQDRFDPEILNLVTAGRGMLASELMDAMIARLKLASAMHAFFEDYDVLLCPTFHCPPPAVPGLPPELRTAPPLTSWCNHTQQPAASIPCGLSSDGLPIGLQVIGPRMHDALVLRVCRAYERARGEFPAPPLDVRRKVAQ